MDDAAREQFHAYVAARSPALLRTAFLLTGSRADAEDLLQTALAKTYLSWDRIRDREALDGYVRRILVNAQTSWWRRRKVDEYATDELPERPARDSAPDFADDLALHDALWTALATLPPRQRAMVVLRYYEDLSEAETAQVLGVSVGTVKSTTFRALAKLRDTSGLRDDPRATLPTGAHA